jgi:hypothetical protein
MSKLRSFCLFLLCMLMYAAQAAVPTTMHYQGYLTTPDGTALKTTVAITASLYEVEAGGLPVWSEQHTVDVSRGLFNLSLGSLVPFPADLFTVPLYLGIQVEDDQEMSPRLALSSAPYAFATDNVISCGDGLTNCNGTCADTTSDVNHCRTCGNACQTSQICDKSVCTQADGDGDGVTIGLGDCDDTNEDVYPGAPELCDGLDNDCDNMIDGAAANDLCDAGTVNCISSICDFAAGGCLSSNLPNGQQCVGGCGTLCIAQGVCLDGACDLDFDKDGFHESIDCDDRNADKFPGQTRFFTTNRAFTPFDYNCDGVAEKQYPAVGSCRGSTFSCSQFTQGWASTVPACGQTGTFIANCLPRFNDCVAFETEVTQACR